MKKFAFNTLLLLLPFSAYANSSAAISPIQDTATLYQYGVAVIELEKGSAAPRLNALHEIKIPENINAEVYAKPYYQGKMKVLETGRHLLSSVQSLKIIESQQKASDATDDSEETKEALGLKTLTIDVTYTTNAPQCVQLFQSQDTRAQTDLPVLCNNDNKKVTFAFDESQQTPIPLTVMVRDAKTQLDVGSFTVEVVKKDENLSLDPGAAVKSEGVFVDVRGSNSLGLFYAKENKDVMFEY